MYLRSNRLRRGGAAYGEHVLAIPGDFCQESGTYRVTHWRHRFPHRVRIAQGTILPACNKCGTRVHFERVNDLTSLAVPRAIDEDEDFGQADSAAAV